MDVVVDTPAASRLVSLALASLGLACGSSPPQDDGDGSSGDSSGAQPTTTSSPTTSDGPTTSTSSATTASSTASTSADDSGSESGEGGSSSDDGGPVITPCDSLAPAGTWENITPPLEALPAQEPCPYGGSFAMNPDDPAMVYAGSCNQGIWKTEDCGATWVHVNTGANGDVLDSGRQWTFAIDPSDPQILYTNSGYGTLSNGAWKSTDGAVSWTQLWPPEDPDLNGIVEYDFVASVVMDPSDPEHIIVTFHATCAAPHSEACFAESEDGGATFRIVDGRAEWAGGEGQFAYFLEARDTWLWGSQSNGLWRTDDAGASWVAVTDDQAQGHGAGQLYRAADGTFYLPVLAGILRSPDGITWTTVENSGNVMSGLTGNGTTMWASRGFPWDPSDDLYEPFWTSPEDDGLTWTKLPSPMLSNGGQLAYDEVHHMLYSSNGGEGLWRVVLE